MNGQSFSRDGSRMLSQTNFKTNRQCGGKIMVDKFLDQFKPRKKRCKKCKESTIHEFAWWYVEGSECPFFNHDKMTCSCSGVGRGGGEKKKAPCKGPLKLAAFCLQCGHNGLDNRYKLHGVIDVEGF